MFPSGEPYAVAVDQANNILVADADHVQFFGQDGAFITAFEADDPYSLCVDRDGRVFVGGNGYLHVFAFPS